MATKKKTTKKAAPQKAVKKIPAKKAVSKKKASKKTASKKASKKKATKKSTATKRSAAKVTSEQSKENLHLLIGRAVTDRRFRTLVAKRPEEALQQYPMLGLERKAVLEALKKPLAAAKAIDDLIDETIGPVGAI